MPYWQTALTLGAAASVPIIGKWLFAREYFKPVRGAFPPYPIVLRPYRWMVVLAWIICALFAVVAIALFILWLFQPLFLMKLVGAIFMAIAGILMWGTYQWSHEYLVIEADGLTYVKSRKSVAIKGAYINAALPSGAGGNLILDVLYQDKKLLIPLTFQGMNLLRQQFERWRSDARERSFHNWRPKEVN